jgi:ParB family chromosome partitioning protein
MVDCSAIEANPFQPRLEPEKANLEELADSIRQVGVIQPLTVRSRGEGRFELIAGERRWRASQLAGLMEVPVIVREINDERMLEEALIENIQREDLNAMDRAVAYRRYCDSFGLTIEQVAERVGEKRQTVSNFLRLLELDRELQDLISHGVLSAGHGKALAGVSDRALRMGLAKTVVARSLSVRALEELVREKKRPGSERTGGGAKKSAAERRAEKRAVVADLEERFSQAVGTHVEILEGKPKGSGQIVVDFYTLDDFDRIAGILGVQLEDEM